VPRQRRDPGSELPPVPKEFIPQLRRPSTQRYRELVVELFHAAQVAERGGDELYVILKCIVSLRHFLDADRIVQVNFLTRPLGTLAKGLLKNN
jgi:hypothetical protein